MWFIGHAALGLLLALPFALRARGQPGRDQLGVTPALLLVVLLAANLPDVLHFGDLRPWTHNLFVGTAMSVALALVLRRPLAFGRQEMAAVLVAGLAHPIGDMAFGEYYPLFPVDPGSLVVGLGWNGVEDLATEMGLGAILLVVLYHPRLAGRRISGPWPGRDDLLVRLAAWGMLLILAANLAVFLRMNLVSGYDRSPLALAVFAQGFLIGIPFIGYAATRRSSPSLPQPTADETGGAEPP